MDRRERGRAARTDGVIPGAERVGRGGAVGPVPRPAAELPRAGVTYGQTELSTNTVRIAEAAPAPGPAPERRPTAKTRKAYAKRARQLIALALQELGGAPDDPDAVTGAEFVTWLIARKPTWVATSWRQNKAALCHAYSASIEKLAARREHETGPAAARIAERIAASRRALARLQAEGSHGCAAETTRTSANKLKALPEADRLAIATALGQIRSTYSNALDDYLLAGVRTGLRPSEWAGTRRLPDEGDDILVLSVANAKNDTERAHGPFRTLRFTSLPAEEKMVILRWLDRVRAADDGIEALMKSLGDLLHTVTRRLWPRRRRRVTLYSARHQFAALAKLNYDAAEVAALLGHATDETASRHYGRYRSGRSLPSELLALLDRLPRPDPDEVRLIRPRIGAARARLAAMRDRVGADASPPAMR